LTYDRIALVILLPSLALLFLTILATIVVRPVNSRQRRYHRQLAELGNVLADASGITLELNWLRYGEIPKPEVLELAAKHDWKFTTDEITAKAWSLRFTR
jgi:hypothetical protein